MGWILRTSESRVNPTLPGGVYGPYITAGRPVYWRHDSGAGRTYFIIFISDGGRYGLKNVSELSYEGGVISGSQYAFHKGKYTKQINSKVVYAGDVSLNKLYIVDNPYSDNDPVRFRTYGGGMPSGLNLNQKYYVKNRDGGHGMEISETPGGSTVDITAFASTGVLYAWKADAGFDDPDQGISTYCPETQETFSGIAYVEGYYNTSSGDEPNWQDFRIVGVGRILMDYDSSGTPLGIVTDDLLLSNPALIGADVLINEYKKPLSRIHWPSWKLFRDAAAQKIWQKNSSAFVNGLQGKYGAFTPGIYEIGLPIIIRTDGQINFPGTSDPPAPGVPSDYHFTHWTGFIEFPYSEVFTISGVSDDLVKVKINNSLIINDGTAGTLTPGSINVATGIKYPIDIEFYNNISPYGLQLYWQSASRALELIPESALFSTDGGIQRYLIAMAFPSPTEACDVFERVMDRCPGWNWTDKNGKIEFLGPNRPIMYEFIFDSISPDINSTLLDGEFEIKKRNKNEKPNYSVYELRDLERANYPTVYVEADRPNLREFGNTSPDNNEPIQLGVMTKSQGERIGELEMVFKADARNTINLGSDRASGGLCKAELVKVTHYVHENKKVSDEYALITSLTRNGKQNSFSLLPVPLNFYKDELYVPPSGSGSGGSGGGGGEDPGGEDPGGGGPSAGPPTDLNIDYTIGNNYSDITWVNHGALGDCIVEKDFNGGGFSTIATLPYTGDYFRDNYIYVTGTYTYRVYNTAIFGLLEGSIYASFFGGGGIGGGCFSGDTPVNITNQDSISFKDLFKRRKEFIGTNILSFNSDNQKTNRKILDIYRIKSNKFCVVKFSNGKKRKVTPLHRFWTPDKKFISIYKLTKGDKVYDLDFNIVEILSVKIKEVKIPQYFYNMSIEIDKAYFVEFAVSNLKPPPGDGEF